MLKTLVSAVMLSVAVSPAVAEETDYCRQVTPQAAVMLKDRPAVVTDIDGVLGQYILLDYGPTNGAFLDIGVSYPREDAALMLNIYHRRGYAIVYMAGRPRQMEVLGKSMCQATLDWLLENGFPVEEGDTLLLLRNGDATVTEAKDPGTAMAEWMGDHGTALIKSFVEEVKGEFGLDPRYGYVDSDVVTDAFIDAGVPAENIFTIGNKGISRLGYRGSTPIIGPESNPGYSDHTRNFVIPKVPDESNVQ